MLRIITLALAPAATGAEASSRNEFLYRVLDMYHVYYTCMSRERQDNVEKCLISGHIDTGRRGEACVPLKFDRLCFLIPICMIILKNKAQIARDTIKTPRAFRALKRALDPGRKGLRGLCS